MDLKWYGPIVHPLQRISTMEEEIELGGAFDVSRRAGREEGRSVSVFTEERAETEANRGGGLDFRVLVLSTGISICITRL